MTLVQVYRIGPIKQSIHKGFVIHGSISKNDLLQLLRNSSSNSVTIRLDPKKENVLWVDTGMVWLHTAQAREDQFRQLSDAIQEIATALNKLGVTLLPGAIRTSPELAWDHFLCGDRHFLEINDPIEKEVTCNLLRMHVPTMIAYSGRAGFDQNGLEGVGSRRLFNSQEHYAMRYLASLTPAHLNRVTQCLRRDDGVSTLDFLDISPLESPSTPGNSIELRFIDSQVYLSTVRAQAILIQALFLQARRLVRDGRRVGDPDQKFLERNRARAITKAMQARFENELDRRESGHKEASSAHAERNLISVQAAWLDLLEGLRREFQILEVEYPEIAPLVLGTSLQQMGFAGLRNENDYLQVMCKSKDWQNGGWVAQIPRQFAEANFYQLSPITAVNEARFPLQANLVRRWWSQALRFDPQKMTKDKPQETVSKAAEKIAANPRSATLHLVETLKRSDGNPTKDVLIAGLEDFEKVSGGNHLDRGLSMIPHPDAQLVRQVYRRLQNQFKLGVLEKGWEDQGAVNALNSSRQAGICLLYFTVKQEQEPRAEATLARLQETVPMGTKIFILSYWKYKSNKDDTPLLKVEVILLQQMERRMP